MSYLIKYMFTCDRCQMKGASLTGTASSSAIQVRHVLKKKGWSTRVQDGLLHDLCPTCTEEAKKQDQLERMLHDPEQAWMSNHFEDVMNKQREKEKRK